MLQDIKKELAGLEMTRRSVRNFGLLFCGVFSLWAGMLFGKGSQQWLWPAVTALVLLVTTLVRPLTLARWYRIWMLFAFILGWFSTRIILTLAYILIMTPIGWMLRISGRDILNERINKDAQSYWTKHEPAAGGEQYKKQF